MQHELREAEQALLHYSFDNPIIDFIRHNENMTFKITTPADNRRYVLRIHKSVADGLSGQQHTWDGLHAEMLFLQTIGQANVLNVQKPVANLAGGMITEYISDRHGPTYATLLEWIDGSTLTLQEEDAERIVYRLGQNVAKLHRFLQSSPPLELRRPAYDADRIDEALVELRIGASGGVIAPEDLTVIEEVLATVKLQLAELDAREGSKGYVHADFQLGNIIVSEEEGSPSLIDFGLFGHGYYLFDLGSACSMLKPELRKTFLDGYASQTAFASDDIRYIEGQIFMDIFISYVFVIHHPGKNQWIKADAANVCSTLAPDFLAGREVLYAF
ncbi:aminoglycoside phosphotransferase family protein [Paenibacillus lycopersici]|uniref:Aminoglycoside phosphotransferase family protein n=1 Tax=Paenibacillus lycopersici TaxID=2704462 RepID=A0A6C0FQ96_9BACL|nr:aminoglycoside phosphotransferase family protein [Paenibacillus lycopersici]QHT59298.1 aminoglycoside phosphotransferase family protein [Paenibacillus lycopersici]